MKIEDADFLLSLKNMPETRKFSIASHEEIKKEAHYKWIEDNIQYFQIIENDGKKAGAVRLRNKEISIWIDRMFWGKGIATYVLEMISEVGVAAKIVEGNIASMRCFINAGFKPVSYHDKYYIFQK